jgi:hypothetical protein
MDRNLSFWVVYLVFVFCIFNFLGCATIKEAAKSFSGVSTKVLEDGRNEALVKTVNYDYDACYELVKDILTESGAYIYAQNKEKQMIAFYVSPADTTPVGLFFEKIDATNTQIEVSSPSTFAKEYVLANILSRTRKNPESEEKEGQADEEK